MSLLVCFFADGNGIQLKQLKIWYFSDVHADAQNDDMPYGYPPENADVCVIAGDILGGPESVDYLASRIRVPIIFVPGNHEYWGHVYQKSRSAMLKCAARHSHVTVLSDGQTTTVGDVLFVGATLFTDFALFGERHVPEVMAEAIKEGFDFRSIAFGRYGEDERLFTPADAKAIHERSLEKIEEALSITSCDRKVVVSHYGPSPQSIPNEFQGVISNAWYVSDLTEFIKRTSPDVWIHGHVHKSFDYRIGKCRVLCNPRGFERENMSFEWDKSTNV